MKLIDNNLRFPINEFEEYSVTVVTSNGKKQVRYRHYENIPYVATPVDLKYQSLCVDIPFSVNETAIDCTNAPILLSIGVGGYFECECGWTFEDEDHFGPLGDPNVRRNTSCAHHLALAAGIVVLMPGCRGRGNQAEDGTYYGKAPAAIVDLKAVVRYIRHNRDIMPGNPEHIITRGSSAGGGLSALLGSSGNNLLFKPYLEELGAADERDDVFASACYSPVMDLEHADKSYEWMYGPYPNCETKQHVDPEVSKEIASSFPAYQKSLGLFGRNGFGLLTAENYGEYLVKEYLIPAANQYLLSELNEQERKEYLKKNPWIKFDGKTANFNFHELRLHIGRLKSAPAFDKLDLSGECSLFGNETINARHFTEYSLHRVQPDAELSAEVKKLIYMMNPMNFLIEENADICGYWWIRMGASENGISFSIPCNLATKLENLDKDVNMKFYWEGKHCADLDTESFIEWICTITDYK